MNDKLKELYKQIMQDKYQVYEMNKAGQISKSDYSKYTYIYDRLALELEKGFELFEN